MYDVSNLSSKTLANNVSSSERKSYGLTKKSSRLSPFGVRRSTRHRFVDRYLIKGAIHEIDETDAEWSEDIEEFAHEMAA